MNINEAFPDQPASVPYKPVEDDLESAIARCADPETSLDFLAEIDGKVRFMEEQIRAYKKARDEAFRERIKASGTGFTLGTVRYRLAMPTETKCRNVGECLQSLLELLGPDGASLCLASSPFKYGQVRSMLTESGNSEIFDQLFETKQKEVLKGEPITEPQLVSCDERFLKTRKGARHESK